MLTGKSNKSGAALLEFAIVAPLFFCLLFNMVYAAMMLHDRHVLSEIVYEQVRIIAGSGNQNISIKPDASGGAGLTYDNTDRDKDAVYEKVKDRLLIYKLEQKDGEVPDITISIVPHEKDVQSSTEETSSYIKVTVHDADINMKVKAKLEEGAVPEIATLVCPDELVVSKNLRIELNINKILTVLGTGVGGK